MSIRWTSLLLGLATWMAGTAIAANDEPLDPEQAFPASVRALDNKTVEVQYKIVDGYYLYRDKIKFKADPSSFKIGAPLLPKGKIKEDEFFGKVETYRGNIAIKLPVEAGSERKLKLVAESQGCADIGICYPPIQQTLEVNLPAAPAAANGATPPAVPTAAAQPPSSPAPAAAGATAAAPRQGTAALPLLEQAAPAPTALPALSAGTTAAGVQTAQLTPASAAKPSAAALESEEAGIAEQLKKQPGVGALATLFVLGLLLAFTPCVLPMVPILSGLIVGSRETVTRWRGLSLAAAYVLGMALTYAAAGVGAAMTGTLLATVLQNPWVLGTFAALFILLALSMFGVYELQVPAALQARFTEASNRLPGGRYAGVFAMGALSALIVGPCVAAPLAGVLLFISQTGNVVFGGLALFVLALGMGVPLLAVGASAGSLLPRAGAWMESVKRFFGWLLLAVAVWLVSPVLPGTVVVMLWAALAIGAGVFLRALDPLPAEAGGWRRLGKAVGVGALLIGAAQLVGALSGATDPAQPLERWVAKPAAPGATPGLQQAALHGGRFQRVTSIQELDAVLANTGGKPVLFDFYADWCVACKEMEKLTFSDPRVADRMNQFLLLQADVTQSSAADRELLKRFNLFGPPGIIFFDAKGQNIPGGRVIGYQPAEKFLATLNAVTAQCGAQGTVSC